MQEDLRFKQYSFYRLIRCRCFKQCLESCQSSGAYHVLAVKATVESFLQDHAPCTNDSNAHCWRLVCTRHLVWTSVANTQRLSRDYKSNKEYASAVVAGPTDCYCTCMASALGLQFHPISELL